MHSWRILLFLLSHFLGITIQSFTNLRFFFYFHSTMTAPEVVDLSTAIRNIFLVFLSQTSKLVPPYSLCLRPCRTFLQTLRCSHRTRCIVHYLMSPTTPKTLPYPIFRSTDSLNPTEKPSSASSSPYWINRLLQHRAKPVTGLTRW